MGPPGPGSVSYFAQKSGSDLTVTQGSTVTVADAGLSGVVMMAGDALDLYVDASGWATGASGAYVGCQLTLWVGSTPVAHLVEGNVFASSTRSPYMKFTIAHRFVADIPFVAATSLTLYAQTGTCILRDAKVWGTVR